MEKLFYKIMYDKRLKRSMVILEMLYKTKHDVTIKELEETLGISRNTVLTTLDFTKKIIPETLSLSINENNVKLHSEYNKSIDIIIIEIAKQTTSFQILEHAFLEKGLNVHELAEALFLSESTLRTRIKHINKTLKDFGCSLSFYDIKFIGDEVNIRYFAYVYFSEFQEFYLSVCEKQLQYCSDIYINMKNVLEKQNNKLMNYSNSQIIRWLTVTRDRLQNDKFIKLDARFIQQISKYQSYKDFKKVYESEIENHLKKTKIPEAESVWAYVVSFNTIIYFNNNNRNLYVDEIYNEPYKEIFLNIVKEMANILEIRTEDIKDFHAVHIAYFINTTLLTNISPIFQKSSANIKNYVINNLGSLYETWFKYLSKLNKNNFFPIIDIQSLSAQLTMISSQFTYTKKAKAKKIVYSFEGENGFIVYLETLAKTLLPNGVEGIFIHNEPITTKLMEQIKPDIIVCNYAFPKKVIGYKTLRMSYIPKINEWTLLKELIINLDFSYSNKRKAFNID